MVYMQWKWVLPVESCWKVTYAVVAANVCEEPKQACGTSQGTRFSPDSGTGVSELILRDQPHISSKHMWWISISYEVSIMKRLYTFNCVNNSKRSSRSLGKSMYIVVHAGDEEDRKPSTGSDKECVNWWSGTSFVYFLLNLIFDYRCQYRRCNVRSQQLCRWILCLE